MLTVSVALTTYNGRQFLPEQLRSLSSQTQLPCELVVGDDCSSDDTRSIVERFAHGAPFPVKLAKNPQRLGWARNFVEVAARCTGDLIAFCDQDDSWEPGKIERCAARFAPDVQLVYHDALIVDAQLAPYGRLTRLPPGASEGTAFELPPFRNPYGFSMVFRRGLADFSGLHETSLDPDRAGQPMAHDQFFFFLASALGHVRHVPECLAKYRQHGANVVGPGVRKPLSYRLRGITEAECDLRARAAESRSHLLQCLSEIVPAEKTAQLNRLADRYGRLAAQYRLRTIVHSRLALRSRVASLLRLAALGYGGGPWSFGWRAGLKDAFAALETSPLLTLEKALGSGLRRLREIRVSAARSDRR
jgi:glycosyltransferase involved in cell wall biosynthesis